MSWSSRLCSPSVLRYFCVFQNISYLKYPGSSHLHIYKKGFYGTIIQKWCQRPKRALFIYTVPSGNPYKHWLYRLIFASICLIILKISFSPSFFGIVTFWSKTNRLFSRICKISCIIILQSRLCWKYFLAVFWYSYFTVSQYLHTLSKRKIFLIILPLPQKNKKISFLI